MNIPPKIQEVPAKSIPLEVLPAEKFPRPDDAPRQGQAPNSSDPRPIHALSAFILIAVDSLWAIFEWVPPLWIFAIPLCFLAVSVPCFLVQKYLKGDPNGRALAFASVMGVLAAIPTPITGTSVGLGVLAWSGLGRFFSRRPRGC
jgi:hypothetical protein